jgi:hypothetical protein
MIKFAAVSHLGTAAEPGGCARPPSARFGSWGAAASGTTFAAPHFSGVDVMLPIYIEAEDRDFAAAWPARDGHRLPLKRIVDDLDPVASILPGAPTSGAVAAHARALAELLDDARIAAAVLAGAAEKAELAITVSPYRMWTSTIPSRAWGKPAVAALQPLRQIIEGCAAFEDAIVGGGPQPGQSTDSASARSSGETKPASDHSRPLTSLELAELERVGLGVTPGDEGIAI